MPKCALVVHGGAGHPKKDEDGCQLAADAGMGRLHAGEEALAAAIAAVVALEDDERFNAGTGAELGLDGRTIEMDAGLMDTHGKLAAIAGIQRVKNPILVARRLADTPMKLVVGEGATRFARRCGFEDYYYVSEAALKHHRELVRALEKGRGGDFPPEWYEYDYEGLWPYDASWEAILKEYGKGTVGAVARDGDGQFAVASSTGGSSPMLRGRVGNTSLIGCGYYAGEAGAFAATGVGEYIIQTMLCRVAYERVRDGAKLQEALDEAVSLIPKDVDVGLIGITATEAGSSSNVPMPTAILED